jgi:DNA-binding transcriptional regulator GbsR (MarR family)
VAAPDRHEVAEQLALVLSTHGMQRMTARVLAALVYSDQPSVTMGELTEQLRASAGAVSGALKMLRSVGVVERVPAPGSRRDHFRLRDDAWAVQYTKSNEALSAVLAAAEAGIEATEDGSLARQRITQMRDFYMFLLEEVPEVLKRWRERLP